MTGSNNDPLSLLDRIIRGQFVGRPREVAEANTLWQRAASGQGQALVVSGEPGIGKTRFVRELAGAAAQVGGLALSGACYPEGGAPYAPLAQLLGDWLETTPRMGHRLPDEALAYLLPVMPALRRFFPEAPSGANPDQRAGQQQVFESFLALVGTLAAQAPVLLFVDDAHWADSDTLALLRHLARRGRKLPLLLALTYREAELASAPLLNEVLVDLNRERLAVQLKLERLTREETRALLAGMFAEEITPDFLDGIYRQTEGNPFFIEEVCKGLIEEGQLSFSGGKWRRPAMAAIKIPLTIRAAIQARLQKLPAATQDVLRMASIFGHDFEFDTFARAIDLGEETLIDALETAARAQLITEVQPGGAGRVRFSFVHGLIPTTLRESIIHVRRRRLHLRAAQAIQAVHPDDYEMLAYQFAEAGEPEPARNYYRLAGDRAQQAAPGEAARFYRAALNGWPEGGQAERASLMARLGYCLWVLGDIQGSLKIYQDAYSIYAGLGDRTHSGEMQRMAGRMYWEQSDREQALRHYHQALAILEEGPETPELARAVSSIGQMYMLAPDNNRAIEWGERALDMARRLDLEDVVIDAMNNIGSNYAQNGDFDKGFSILQESLTHANAAGLPMDVCRAYYNSSVMLQRYCHYQRSLAVLEELHDYAGRRYAKNYVNQVEWRLMWVHWLRGEWSAAIDYRGQIVELTTHRLATMANRVFGLIDLDLGRFTDARRELEENLPGALSANDLQTTVPHLGLLARAYDALGLADQAVDFIRQTIKIVADAPCLSHESIMPLFYAGQIAAHMPGGSLETAQTCLALLRRHVEQFHTDEAEAAAAETQGCILILERQPQAAVEMFRSAAAFWERIGRLYDQARALGQLGRGLAALGDASGAGQTYDQALVIVNRLASQLDPGSKEAFLETRFAREIQGASQPSTPAAPRKNAAQPIDNLTEREAEVLRLVADGLTNAQIAGRLVLSPLTVNAHLRSIFNKLDVTTRTAAVRKAQALGKIG